MTRHPLRFAGRRLARPGFTLIELLTVIAIIGILAAIIIPVVGKVRESARWSQGLNNVRQVTGAMLIYATDNKGTLLAGLDKDSSNNDQDWGIVLARYMNKWGDGQFRTGDVFLDPVALAQPQWSNPPAWAKHMSSLGFTRRMDINPGRQDLQRFRKVDAHRTPSQQILMADAGLDATGNSQYDIWNIDGGWLNFPNPAPANLADTPIDPGNNTGGRIRWTGDKAKFGFMDGHVAVLKQTEVLKRNVNPFFQ